MHTFDIIFTIKQLQFNDELISFIESHLALLNKNGQFIERNYSCYLKDNQYHVIVSTPEKNSLNDCFNNPLINQSLQQAAQLNISIQKNFLGSILDHTNDPQKNTPSSAYILFTHFLDIGSPVHCFDRFASIPLYHLPKINHEQDYYSFLNWQTQYQACDTLQMNCRILENEAINQIANVQSDLSQLGLSICNALSTSINKPVYYYLHQYQTQQSNHCPLCKEAWKNISNPNFFFDLICNFCHLLSKK